MAWPIDRWPHASGPHRTPAGKLLDARNRLDEAGGEEFRALAGVPLATASLALAFLLACEGETPPREGDHRMAVDSPDGGSPQDHERASFSAAPGDDPDRPRPRTRLPPPAGLVDVVAFVPHVRLAIGYATADNFTGAPLPGYGAAAAWLHPAAANALASAAVDLAEDGLAIVVFDGYRPRRASEAMVAWARANDRTDLLRDGWVAARSQHNRGLAIDVGLADLATGERLDMGTGWDAFTPRSRAHAVGGVPGDRRRTLRAAMLRHGFSPYDGEWWHFAWKASAPELDVPYGVDEE